MNDNSESSTPHQSDAGKVSGSQQQSASGRLAAYKNLFNRLDKEDTETIPISMLKFALQMEAQAPTEKELEEIKEPYMDTTLEDPETTPIDFDTFCTVLEENSLNSNDRLSKLLSAFCIFDETSQGHMHLDKLHEYMLTLGDCLSEKEAIEFIRDAQPGKDGLLSYLDFAHRMVEGYPPLQPKKKTPRGREKGKPAKVTPSTSNRKPKSEATPQPNQSPDEA